jgi:lysophospholipase L1-like esterase
MRNPGAELNDEAVIRAALETDREWQRAHAGLGKEQRQRRLEADAREAAQIPRWYMRPELRSFDHIHPNVEGHRIMAEVACPQLPASWKCSCP